MASDNQTNDQLRELYESHPYPGTGPMPPARELVNLVKLYQIENSLPDTGLNLLDVGVGSGNRLLELVRDFPGHTYTAIDYSETALDHARERFREEGFDNVEFKQVDLEDDLAELGKFDVITCMGVLHHLRDPNVAWRNISQLSHENSIGFFYVYGRLGSVERIRRKSILEILAKETQDLEWFEWVRACNFVDLAYGWRGLGDGLPLYLDAYKNPRERLFDLSDILALLDYAGGGWRAAALQGWISEGKGWLVDIDARQSRLPIASTTLKPLSEDRIVSDRFVELDILERLRLLEQVYQPEAYTVVLWGREAFAQMPHDSRLARGAIALPSR